jgi:glycosyltransferase involved in cell wall biosynthesis
VSRHLALIALGGCGGSSVAAVELAAGMALAGHTIELLSARPLRRRPDLELRCGGRLRRHVLGTRHGAQALAESLERLHAAAPLDEVQVHYLHPNLPVALESIERMKGPRPTLVAVAHGTDVTLHAERWGDPRLDRVDHWLAPSVALANRLDDRLGRRVTRALPLGVDLERFRPTATRSGAPTVAHVTNFASWKRPVLALQVLRRLRGAGLPARLRMIGDGPGRSRVARRAAELGVADAVEWTGGVETRSEHFAGCGVVLSTSREESFGLGVLEGLACGLHAVAPRVPGLADTIGGPPAGTLVADPTPGALARAVAAHLRRPDPAAARRRAERFQIAEAARAWAAVGSSRPLSTARRPAATLPGRR